jgi:hypothetical protein
MKTFGKISHALRLLPFLITHLLVYSIDAANAVGINYRPDKTYHHPDDESYEYTILWAEMSIDDIDAGKFNLLLPSFMASLVLLAIYPLARWRSKEAAKMVSTPPPVNRVNQLIN